jgi:hypothetical protein
MPPVLPHPVGGSQTQACRSRHLCTRPGPCCYWAGLLPIRYCNTHARLVPNSAALHVAQAQAPVAPAHQPRSAHYMLVYTHTSSTQTPDDTATYQGPVGATGRVGKGTSPACKLRPSVGPTGDDPLPVRQGSNTIHAKKQAACQTWRAPHSRQRLSRCQKS